MTRALVTQLVEALNKCRDWPGAHDECSAAILAAREYLATEPSGERAELISGLRRIADEGMADYANTGYPNSNAIKKAADMLEADATLIDEDTKAKQVSVPAGWKPDMEHLTNEWADVATSAIVWLHNIKDGISTVDEAIENTNHGILHCREVGKVVRAALGAKLVAQQADKPTGWDNGLSQDYCKEFGQWLASRPGARQQIKAMFDTSTPLQP